MMRNMTNWCCGPDGRPDFDKMTEYMMHHDRASKYDVAGWSLFFVWVGIAWLADVGLGLGLLGVAFITLGMQAVRKAVGVRVEGFWILVGLGFAVAGLWQWLNVETPLAPFVLIVFGVALFIGSVRPRTRPRRR